MIYRIFIMLVLVFSFISACSKERNKTEITVEKAIQIASNFADNKNYNTQKADVEIIKVKKGIERGPIRLVWLVRYFPREKSQTVISKEFWIVYFYQKGQLEKANILGGDFCVLVDLYSGEVIESFAGI